MARKKKLSLEQEFAKRVKAHKTFIIMDAIISTGERIYNSKFFRTYKRMEVEPYKSDKYSFDMYETKAMYVEDDLAERARNGEQVLYDDIYEYCWRKVRRTINDTDTPEQHGLKA